MTPLRIWIAACAALGLGACYGNQGDICQVSTDCNAQFVCCRRAGAGAVGITPKGTCELASTCSGATDSGVPEAGTDLGTVDAGHDAGVDSGADAGMDAGTDASADAGTDASVDTGGIDANADAGDDAGIDLGP